MTDTPHPAGEQGRQLAIDRLSEAFAADALPVDEFERRIELVHEAQTVDQLSRLLSDLPKRSDLPARSDDDADPGTSADRQALSRPLDAQAAGVRVPEQSIVMGALGGASRKGQWVPARSTTAIGVFGGVELDMREALLGPGVTEIKCFALWGGVEIIVPPGVSVECDGIGIMGGFEQRHEARLLADPDAPVIRVRGLAIMGGVSVTSRYVGESTREAKKRLRAEHKARRRLNDGG